MTEEVRVRTRCPNCRTAYKVPLSAVGHRARCVKCQLDFRIVSEERRTPHPTEDDILRWLMEGFDEPDFEEQPPVVRAGRHPEAETVVRGPRRANGPSPRWANPDHGLPDDAQEPPKRKAV